MPIVLIVAVSLPLLCAMVAAIIWYRMYLGLKQDCERQRGWKKYFREQYLLALDDYFKAMDRLNTYTRGGKGNGNVKEGEGASSSKGKASKPRGKGEKH